MQTKDYYKILELPPSATLQEIKTAYRRLAHQFHPDKNNNNLYAAAQFEIIKEAYEVLSNPSKKEYYLQQRWYDQSMNIKQTDRIITPVTVLKQVLDLNKYVSKLDMHRMDQEGLYLYICHVLSDDTIKKLNKFNESDINNSIVESILKSTTVLSLSYIDLLSKRLTELTIDTATRELIGKRLKQARKSFAWHKYRIWLLLFIVLVLCFLIYTTSNR